MIASAPERKPQDYRLVPIAAATWLGVVLGLIGLVWGAVIAALPCLVYTKMRLTGGVWCLALLLGFGAGTLAMQGYERDAAAKISDGQTAVFSVILKEDPQRRVSSWGSVQWDARIEIVEVDSGNVVHLSMAEAIISGDTIKAFHRYDRLRVYGALKKGFRDTPPLIGVVKAKRVRHYEPARGWQAIVGQIRQNLHQRTAKLSSAAQGLIPGMALGDESNLQSEVKDAMKTVSLIHITAVSGAHLAIALSVLGAVIPGGRITRATIAAVFALLLLGVVGPEPSVIRAVATCWVSSWGLAGRRRGQPQTTLSIVVLLCVLLHPWIAVEIGFALSVLATWGLLFTGRELMECWRVKNRVFRFLIEACALTLSAQLWAMPVLLTFNDVLPLWAPLANVLVAPAIPVVTIAGMLAAACGMWVPQCAEILCALAAPFADWIAFVALTCAQLPAAQVPWFSGWLAPLAWIPLIVLVVVWQSLRRRIGGTRGGYHSHSGQRSSARGP